MLDVLRVVRSSLCASVVAERVLEGALDEDGEAPLLALGDYRGSPNGVEAAAHVRQRPIAQLLLLVCLFLFYIFFCFFCFDKYLCCRFTLCLFILSAFAQVCFA